MLRILLLLFLAATAYANLEEYFKDAPNKKNGSQLRGIDFIYMINLDQRPEKFAKCFAEFSFYGIEPYRFSAVNGWELSLEAINDVGAPFQPWMSMAKWGTYYEGDFEPRHEPVSAWGRTYFCHCMSRGAIGIVLSHLSILQDAWDSGYETIWVMEDDVEILKDPHMIPDLIDRLNDLVGVNGWDVLFTDPDTKNQMGQYVPSFGFAWRPNYFPPDPDKYAQRIDISPDFRRVGSRFGAYSMIIKRSGMEKVLNFIKEYKIFLPYDIDFVLPPGIRLVTLTYDVVSTQPKAISDNGAPNYIK
ncbi:MAG: glycosyltransferase family 25 protein [Parachlamydiales bacterium]|nr:glycosyltransferase family 25 protein [Parachlamydiales bacterium]